MSHSQQTATIIGYLSTQNPASLEGLKDVSANALKRLEASPKSDAFNPMPKDVCTSGSMRGITNLLEAAERVSVGDAVKAAGENLDGEEKKQAEAEAKKAADAANAETIALVRAVHAFVNR